MPTQAKPLVIILGDERLTAAEVSDMSRLLKVSSFEEMRCLPKTAEEHDEKVERLRPAAVVLPRKPLNTKGRTLPFNPSAKAKKIARHYRFDYRLPRFGEQRTRQLKSLEGACA